MAKVRILKSCVIRIQQNHHQIGVLVQKIGRHACLICTLILTISKYLVLVLFSFRFSVTMFEKKEEDAIIGFLHNVSPLKKSARTPYFDMQIQTSSDVMRGVCFTSARQQEFKQLSEPGYP